jgi:hypothetical protein
MITHRRLRLHRIETETMIESAVVTLVIAITTVTGTASRITTCTPHPALP